MARVFWPHPPQILRTEDDHDGWWAARSCLWGGGGAQQLPDEETGDTRFTHFLYSSTCSCSGTIIRYIWKQCNTGCLIWYTVYWGDFIMEWFFQGFAAFEDFAIRSQTNSFVILQRTFTTTTVVHYYYFEVLLLLLLLYITTTTVLRSTTTTVHYYYCY